MDRWKNFSRRFHPMRALGFHADRGRGENWQRIWVYPPISGRHLLLPDIHVILILGNVVEWDLDGTRKITAHL
ncbi:uncharacterized protein N7500_010845 [Penicillium coprophilum]|uniref:uncharacterized protein n=1 Tax=Penicillium coprophilum TaxID=36646 RepID=UPI002381D44B|nr:uncharacterized protein N7500_010845 [Penicillium coprophilum]KAJ5150656.1 hypothetical protein N7500_010845 [Penicillium coprophilum]